MPLQVRCDCGKSAIYPDSFAGRTLPCRACRKPLEIAGESVAPPRASFLRRYLPYTLVLLIPVIVGVVFINSRSHHFTPVLEEYREGSKEKVSPEADRPRVEETIARLVKASADDNPEHFAWCFNTRRMLAEIELRGGLNAIGLKREETSLADDLDGSIRRFCEGQRLNGTTWRSVQRCTVRFVENRGEAEAYTAIRTATGVLRLRFWLIKEKNEWSIFDFESLELGIRESASQGRHLARAAAGDSSARTRDQADEHLTKAQQWLARDKAQEALASLNAAEPLSGKGELLATVEMLQAVTLVRLERPEEALRKIEQAMQHRKDMPLAFHLRGIIRYTLGRFEECIQDQQEYLRIIGDDVDAWYWTGMAYEELQKPEKASEAYRRGAAADDQETKNRTKLKALQETRK